MYSKLYQAFIRYLPERRETIQQMSIQQPPVSETNSNFGYHISVDALIKDNIFNTQNIVYIIEKNENEFFN